MTFNEIKSERVSKLIGLCSHFVYWCVFGNFNDLPLDDYHMKQLMISMLQCMSLIELRFQKNETAKKLWCNFVMPMMILAIRVEVEIIFRKNYNKFLKTKKVKGGKKFNKGNLGTDSKLSMNGGTDS